MLSIKILPAFGISKPAISLKRVVFPHPEGPNNEKNCPSEISSETIVDIWDMVIGQSLTEQAAQNKSYTQIQLIRDRLESISEVGSIKKIEFEKSGMNYRLAPDVHVTNTFTPLKL